MRIVHYSSREREDRDKYCVHDIYYVVEVIIEIYYYINNNTYHAFLVAA